MTLWSPPRGPIFRTFRGGHQVQNRHGNCAFPVHRALETRRPIQSATGVFKADDLTSSPHLKAQREATVLPMRNHQERKVRAAQTS